MNRDELVNELIFHEEGFFDIEEKIYHKMPEVSKSQLDIFHKAPAKYLYNLEHPRKETVALHFGDAFHTYLLEEDRFNDEFTIPFWGDRRTKKGKAEYFDWLEENPDGKIIKSEDLNKIQLMKQSIMENEHARALLTEKTAHIEKSMFWKDEKSGLFCRGRTDIIRTDHIIVDIKTTADASMEEFSRSIYKYRYYVQDAFYSSGYRALKNRFPKFCFIVVEKEPPYLCAVYQIDKPGRELGRLAYETNLHALNYCLEENYFPGYSDYIEEISLPRWAT